TPQDFCEMPRSSSADSFPAPGISRSITYFGMVMLHSSEGQRTTEIVAITLRVMSANLPSLQAWAHHAERDDYLASSQATSPPVLQRPSPGSQCSRLGLQHLPTWFVLR